MPPRRREQVAPGALRGKPQVELDMLGRQLLGIRPESELAGERQARQMQQILILDKDAVQLRLGVRGEPRCGLDRDEAFARRVERHDDPLDLSSDWRAAHGRFSPPDAARASSAALAAKASRRAAIRWFSVPGG